MAFIFVSSETVISAILVLISVVVWYLMANCSWRYEILRHQMIKMGELRHDDAVYEQQMSNTERDNLYLRDLVIAIESRKCLEEK